ncbi:MAG: hypothetical protein MZV63_46645 [Marinilabiliales bacterium]|nr:hypothetical protein [Marinilabiliales bacterium]
MVAGTRAQAKAAAALVKVTATPVKAVLTIDEALEPGAPVVPAFGDLQHRHPPQAEARATPSRSSRAANWSSRRSSARRR